MFIIFNTLTIDDEDIWNDMDVVCRNQLVGYIAGAVSDKSYSHEETARRMIPLKGDLMEIKVRLRNILPPAD
jgi:hypothetical protein